MRPCYFNQAAIQLAGRWPITRCTPDAPPAAHANTGARLTRLAPASGAQKGAWQCASRKMLTESAHKIFPMMCETSPCLTRKRYHVRPQPLPLIRNSPVRLETRSHVIINMSIHQLGSNPPGPFTRPVVIISRSIHQLGSFTRSIR